MATEAEKETTGKGQLVVMYFIGKKKRTENAINTFRKNTMSASNNDLSIFFILLELKSFCGRSYMCSLARFFYVNNLGDSVVNSSTYSADYYYNIH